MIYVRSARLSSPRRSCRLFLRRKQWDNRPRQIEATGAAMEFVARSADGQTVRYKDPKRYAWLAAFVSPFLGLATVFAYFASGAQPWVLFVPLAYMFVLIPIVD